MNDEPTRNSGKGTKAMYEKKDVIDTIIKMRLEKMCSTKTILDFLKNQLGYSTTQSYEYLKMAREEIKDVYDFMNPAKIEEAIGQYEEVLERARDKKDWKLWNELRKEYNKIMGIYADKKIDITSNGESIVTGIDITIINPGTNE